MKFIASIWIEILPHITLHFNFAYHTKYLLYNKFLNFFRLHPTLTHHIINVSPKTDFLKQWFHHINNLFFGPKIVEFMNTLSSLLSFLLYSYVRTQLHLLLCWSYHERLMLLSGKHFWGFTLLVIHANILGHFAGNLSWFENLREFREYLRGKKNGRAWLLWRVFMGNESSKCMQEVIPKGWRCKGVNLTMNGMSHFLEKNMLIIWEKWILVWHSCEGSATFSNARFLLGFKLLLLMEIFHLMWYYFTTILKHCSAGLLSNNFTIWKNSKLL